MLMAMVLITVACSPCREMSMPLANPVGREIVGKEAPPPPPSAEPPNARPFQEPEGARPRQIQIRNPPGTGTTATKKRNAKRKRQAERRRAAMEEVQVEVGVRRLVLNEPPETPKTSGMHKRKRALATGSTDGSIEQPKKRLNFKEAAAKCLAVRATYNGSSGIALLAADMDVLKGALEARVRAAVGVSLKFEGMVESSGLLHIYCGDEATKLWTEGTIPLVEEGKFRVCDTGEEPPSTSGALRANVKLRTWIGGSVEPDPKCVFFQLGQQNGIDTSHCKCRAVTTAPKGGYNLFFGVAEAALTSLKQRDMSLYYGLGRITVHKVIQAHRASVGPNGGGGAPTNN
jgi:hypothetical protein